MDSKVSGRIQKCIKDSSKLFGGFALSAQTCPPLHSPYCRKKHCKLKLIIHNVKSSAVQFDISLMDQSLFLGWALIKKTKQKKNLYREISSSTWMSEVTSLLPGGRDLMNFLMKAIRTKTMTVNPTEMAMSKTSSFMFKKEFPKTWCWDRRQTVNVNLGRQRRSDWSAPVEAEKSCCVLGVNPASGKH